MKNQLPVYELFDYKLMKKFYKPEYVDDVNVQNAWYCYCAFFMPKVNAAWQTALTQRVVQQETDFHSVCTVSDEALVQWLIEIEYPMLAKRNEEGWPDRKFGLKGAEATRSQTWRFPLLYNVITAGRRDPDVCRDWNKLFWHAFKIYHPELFETKKRKRLNVQREPGHIHVPMPGFDDDALFTNPQIFAVYANETDTPQTTRRSPRKPKKVQS
jgi:hypothetical protein